MTGWKTIAGAICIGIGTVLVTLPPLFAMQKEIAELLLGLGAAAWRLFPGPMTLLHTGLLGDRADVGGVGPNAFVEVISRPLFGVQWSTDMVSASVAMIVAWLFALPIAWIYILTRQKKGFRQSQVHTLVMLPVVVAGWWCW